MGHEFESSEEEISLNKLALIFFLGLLILFGTYFIFYDKERYIQRIPSNIQICLENWWNGLRNRFSAPVNKFDLDSFEFISCADCNLAAVFEGQDVLKVEYKIPHNKGRLSIFFHKIFERIFNIPVDYGWVSISSEVLNEDWSRYNSANFFVKGSGEPSRLEFSVYESDGDAWYFFDEAVLKTKNGVLVNMPFEDFIHPFWVPSGDGKKDFRNVTMFKITITSFDRAVNNTLEFSLKNNNLIYLT